MKIYIITIFILLIIVCLIIIKTKSNKPIESMKSMTFHYSVNNAYLGNVNYEIKCEEKCIATIKPEGVKEEDAKIIEVKDELVQELISFFNENKVYRWDGFKKSDLHVLDGNSFHFYYHEKNGRGIDASGYMKYPKNYKTVRDRLDQVFMDLYNMKGSNEK